MTSSEGRGIPFRLPPEQEKDPFDIDEMDSSASVSSGDVPVNNGKVDPSPDASSKASSSSIPLAGEESSLVKTTRTRTVKSRAIFTPEDDTEKKPRGRRGRRKRAVYRKSDLKVLLKDEDEQSGAGASSEVVGEGLRKRSRNASDGENRWDRIRAKVKLLLQKMRRDAHFLQVYQQDGWKSSGREKLKPTAELSKAKERMSGVKSELREVAKRLTEMNSGGARWGGIQEDKEGNIKVDEIMCTKCGRGDSDDLDDILLCDYAGCFRAYHQNCLTPAVKPEAFPSEEEDWFCWQCECLTDCLEMIEAEFPGSKLESWEDVFRDAEPGAGVASGKIDVLPTDSEDSDDESFKGSSSESEDENPTRESPQKFDSKGNSNGAEGDSEGDGSDHEDSGIDDDTRWMSDAESVGSDEVAKLHDEAGDLGGFESENEEEHGGGASTPGGGRGGRARARRKLRIAALGLEGDADEKQERKAIVAALAGDGTLDEGNILRNRTRGRKSVDYVKLNEIVFGDESVDGDQASSDEQGPQPSEASEPDSDGSDHAVPVCKPKRRSTPSIDPLTGEKRKRGRPRKIGITTPAVPMVGGSAGVAGDGPPKRKRGRPRKVENADPATVVPKRKRGRPRKVQKIDDPGSVVPKRKPGRPRKAESMSGNGAGSGTGSVAGPIVTEKRKRGRPRKHVETPKNASTIFPRSGSLNGGGKKSISGEAIPLGVPRLFDPETSLEEDTAYIAAAAAAVSPLKKRRTIPGELASHPSLPAQPMASASPSSSWAQDTLSANGSVPPRTGAGSLHAAGSGGEGSLPSDTATVDGRESEKTAVFSPFVGFKRGRGRPRKNSGATASNGGSAGAPSSSSSSTVGAWAAAVASHVAAPFRRAAISGLGASSSALLRAGSPAAEAGPNSPSDESAVERAASCAFTPTGRKVVTKRGTGSVASGKSYLFPTSSSPKSSERDG